MQWNLIFFLNSILLGAGLAMDAFSVSLANGLNEPEMKGGRMNLIAGVYAVFQFAMPMLGWLCVHTLISLFNSLEKLVPWVALALLVICIVLFFVRNKLFQSGFVRLFVKLFFGGEEDE